MTANWIVPRRATRLSRPAFFGPQWNLERFFDDLPLIDRSECAAGNRSFSPVVNIEETEDELRVSAELPGLSEGDFEITTDGDLLTIKGEKKFESTSEDKGRKRTERSRGSFERNFRIAWEIDSETVKAVYKNGVLDLVIPKPEEEQPQVRTIPVTVS
jgi:HSP20 family protein